MLLLRLGYKKTVTSFLATISLSLGSLTAGNWLPCCETALWKREVNEFGSRSSDVCQQTCEGAWKHIFYPQLSPEMTNIPANKLTIISIET